MITDDVIERYSLIRQPYRITMARWDFSVLQKRILTKIISKLQKEISLLQNGLVFEQLDLFKNSNNDADAIKLTFLLSEFVKDGNNYAQFKKAINQLRAFNIEIIKIVLPAVKSKKAKKPEEELILTGLIEMAVIKKYARDITISLHKATAMELVKVANGLTVFAEEVMYETNNKYTQKIYELICQWKDIGVYTLTVAKDLIKKIIRVCLISLITYRAMIANKTTGSKATLKTLLLQMPQWKQVTSPGSHQVLSRIERCHTADFGDHAYSCSDSDCGAMQYIYHSCRNRHCPACGNNKKEVWIESRMKELLPVKYYHAVFTLPHQLNSLILGNRTAMFKLLFDAASYALLKFGNDDKYLGAQLGIIMVLHTWGQQLNFHPHVHCIVSGGGIDKDKRWKEAVKAKHKFLFPADAVAEVYRAYFLKHLQQHIDNGIVTMTAEQRE